MVALNPPIPIPDAPGRQCPQCTHMMQHVLSTRSTHQYVCYNHDQPYYFNDHYTIPVDDEGKIKVMSTIGRRRMSGKL